MTSSLVFRGIAIIVILALAAIPALYFYRANIVESVFWSASRNTPCTEIENELGAPDSTGECGENLWRGGDQANPDKNNGECVVWVRYNFFLEAYAFGYSATGRLTSKYRYVSE